MKLPWYKDGLRFKCTGCGKCCTGESGYVWITDEDIVSLAKAVKLSTEEFVKLHVRLIEGRMALKEIKRDNQFDCIFLEEAKFCRVYESRPVQCRNFPWWPRNLESKAAWQEAALECEGINHPEAPLISFEEIEKVK